MGRARARLLLAALVILTLGRLWLVRGGDEPAPVPAPAPAPAAATPGANLLRNGNFDEGEKTAVGWEIPDGLTAVWVTEEGRGRVLKMDTRVDKNQARKWNMEFRANPSVDRQAPAPVILPLDSFGTIGGNDGVALDSDFIEAKDGQNYQLTADVRGPGSPIVWIKGFFFYKGRWRDVYQTRLTGGGVNPKTWTTITAGFNPTKMMTGNKSQRFKVRIYAYWPNGIYYFDNIRVEEITEAEMARLVKERENPK